MFYPAIDVSILNTNTESCMTYFINVCGNNFVLSKVIYLYDSSFLDYVALPHFTLCLFAALTTNFCFY